MFQQVIKDGHRKERTLNIEGFVKPSGIVCAQVENDKHEHYFVTVSPDGTSTCKQENGEKCKGHKFSGMCYHVKAVLLAHLPLFTEVDVYPSPEEIAEQAEQENMVKLAEYRLHLDPNAYEVLAETKHTHCHGCGGVCGEGRSVHCTSTWCCWNSWYSEEQRAS